MNIVRALVLGLALALVAGGARADTVLRRGNGAEPATLDPQRATGITEANVINDLFEGLVTLGPTGAILPGVAQSWEVSPDGRLHTFHLRPQARWSNGEPVTAGDFLYSLRRAVDPATASDYAPVLAPILHAEDIIAGRRPPADLGVAAPDAATLTLALKAPTPYLLGLLAHTIAFPVHRATVEAFGEAWTRPGNAVTNGAYAIAEWTPQARLVVVRNPHFHDAGNVRIDRVIYHPTEDVPAELKRYRAGELDVTFQVPVDQIKWVTDNLPDQFWNKPYLGTYYYVFNLTRAPFRENRKLRRALSLAVDREILVHKVTRAGELPAYGWVPPGLTGYAPQGADFRTLTQAQRAEEARRLFAEAGYGPGKPLAIELLYNTSENHKKIAVAVAALWQQTLGKENITVTLTNKEWKVYLESRHRRDYQIARAAWIGDYDDPSNFLDLFLSAAGGRNESGYDNPRFDQLLIQAATTADPAARMGLLEEAEQVLIDDMPIIPLYHYATKYLVNPKVKGWAFNIRDIHLSRFLWLGL